MLVSPTENIPPVSATVISAAWEKVSELAIASISRANELVAELEVLENLPVAIWNAVWSAPCWTESHQQTG